MLISLPENITLIQIVWHKTSVSELFQVTNLDIQQTCL